MEIDELEEELEHAHAELNQQRSGNADVNALKQRIADLENQLRSHNERA